MSGLAKFFVVINLVLALFFLGVSATLFKTQKNWKEVAQDAQMKMEDNNVKAEAMKRQLNGTILQKQANVDSLEREKEQLGTQVNTLQNENGDLRKDKASLGTKISDLESRIAQKDTHLQDKDSNIARLEEEISKLNDENHYCNHS